MGIQTTLFAADEVSNKTYFYFCHLKVGM